MTLDETLKWRYSELTVIQNEGAAIETEAVMHRNMNALGIAHSFLIAPEAFEGEQGCMQRQLAVLLECEIAEIEYEFTLLRQGWEEEGGPDANLLLAYCAKAGMSCYLFWADRLIRRGVHPNASMCVCVAIWDDHCYFYRKGSRATDICKKMLARMPQALPAWRLKSDLAPSRGELVIVPWGVSAQWFRR